MDAFEHIATIFEKDCVKRMNMLRRAQIIVDFSDSMAMASRLIFLQTSIYVEDLHSIPYEIERMRNCIEGMEETIFHSRRLFALNFNTGSVFHKEICFSYACKMLNSTGPRHMHFSGSPTTDEIVEAKLFVALNSPYNFGVFEDNDLFCYESME